jgi:hypothetical protein
MNRISDIIDRSDIEPILPKKHNFTVGEALQCQQAA